MLVEYSSLPGCVGTNLVSFFFTSGKTPLGVRQDTYDYSTIKSPPKDVDYEIVFFVSAIQSGTTISQPSFKFLETETLENSRNTKRIICTLAVPVKVVAMKKILFPEAKSNIVASLETIVKSRNLK